MPRTNRLGLRVEGVYGSWFRVEGVGCRVSVCKGLKVEGLWLGVEG
jgi:hypothetical protein